MAQNVFVDRPTDELITVQRVHRDDYYRLKTEADNLGARYRSGQENSDPIFRKLERTIKQKLAALRAVNMIGEVLDSRDGTVRA